jgi:hypothetical protein
MLYFGIDQHARQITVSLRGDTGNVLLARQVSTEPDRIHAFFDQLTRNRLRGWESFVALLEVAGPPVADGNREAMRPTSTMGDCNASALVPLRKRSNGVVSPRLFSETSASARTSKGFLIVGTSVTPSRREFKNTISSSRRLASSSAVGDSRRREPRRKLRECAAGGAMRR